MLIKQHAMKMCGVKVQFYAFLASVLVKMSGQLQAPTALPQTDGPRYQLDTRMGWPQRRFLALKR
jgi:hypothetical protein